MLLPSPWSANVALSDADTYAAPGTTVPGNSNALLPIYPLTHSGELFNVPVLPLPLESAAVLPDPSLKSHRALRPLDVPLLPLVMTSESTLEVLPLKLPSPL
jgi:hypothetical protein